MYKLYNKTIGINVVSKIAKVTAAFYIAVV